MRTLVAVLLVPGFAACFEFGLAAGAPIPKDPPKANPADKLVGAWKLVASSDKLPEDAEVTVEFTGDGALLLRVTIGRAVNATSRGTYKADADKLHYVLADGSGERKETLNIHTLTADTLVVIDPEKKREEFRRVVKK